MTEHIKEQISCFIDDELSPEQCEFFVRRLQRDVESRRQYIRYQVIGAAIRGENVVRDYRDLPERLRHALADKPADAEGSDRRPHALWRWAAGGAIAVSVAAIGVLGLRFGGVDAIVPGFREAAIDQELQLVEPPSYVVPLSVPERQLVTPTIQLIGLQYLMHHGGHTSMLSRTVVSSNVVMAPEDDADFSVANPVSDSIPDPVPDPIGCPAGTEPIQ